MRRAGNLVVLSALAISWLRFWDGAVYTAQGNLSFVPSWFAEELPPLFRVLDGGNVEAIDQRQYGPVALLVMELGIRILGRDPTRLNLYTLLLALASGAGAFALLT